MDVLDLDGAGYTTAGDIKITNAGTIISHGATHENAANRTSGNLIGDVWSDKWSQCWRL